MEVKIQYKDTPKLIVLDSNQLLLDYMKLLYQNNTKSNYNKLLISLLQKITNCTQDEAIKWLIDNKSYHEFGYHNSQKDMREYLESHLKALKLTKDET